METDPALTKIMCDLRPDFKTNEFQKGLKAGTLPKHPLCFPVKAANVFQMTSILLEVSLELSSSKISL